MPNILKWTAAGDYIYVLANFLKEEPYREWLEGICAMKNRPFIMMDNGTYELGTPIANQLLIDYTVMYRPDVVIAPDYIGDMHSTLAAFQPFRRKWKKMLANWSGTKLPQFMAVLQGKTFQELYQCYQKYREYSVNYIGVPIHVHRILGRPQFISWLRYAKKGVGAFHLLGLDDLAELWCYSGEYHVVSVDTTLPVYLCPQALFADRPKVEQVDHNAHREFAPEDQITIWHNIKQYLTVAEETGGP